MWNLRNKINEQTNRNRLIDTDNKLIVSRREGVGRVDQKGEGIKKYKLTVTK